MCRKAWWRTIYFSPATCTVPFTLTCFLPSMCSHPIPCSLSQGCTRHLSSGGKGVAKWGRQSCQKSDDSSWARLGADYQSYNLRCSVLLAPDFPAQLWNASAFRKVRLHEKVPDHCNYIMSLIKAEGWAIKQFAAEAWPVSWKSFGLFSPRIPWMLYLSLHCSYGLLFKPTGCFSMNKQ